MRHLESFSDHEFIHLVNCGYVIYRGVSGYSNDYSIKKKK
jgi:hypothetical protein